MSNHSLRTAHAAVIPAAALPRLGLWRTRDALRALPAGEVVWLFWPDDPPGLREALAGTAGCVLYTRLPDGWHRAGEPLPCSDVPGDGEARPLAGVLVPAIGGAEPPGEWVPSPELVRLVPGGGARGASAQLVDIAALLTWANAASPAALAPLSAARRGSLVLLTGTPQPPIAGAVRLWGGQLLRPLGLVCEPAWDESTLLAAFGASPGECVVWTEGRAFRVPGSAFGPLTRAGVRLLAGGMA